MFNDFSNTACGVWICNIYFVCLVLWLLLCQKLPLGVRNLATCKHTREKKRQRGLSSSNINSHDSDLIS